jgi:hypothetical protein
MDPGVFARAARAAVPWLLAMSLAHAQTAPQTPQQGAAEIHAGCMKMEPAVRAQAADSAAVMAQFDYVGYCGCVRDETAGRLTQAMLRGADDAALDRMVRDVTGTCGERAVRAMMTGPQCGRFMQAATAQAGTALLAIEIGLACDCVKQALDGLHGADLVAALTDVTRSTTEQRAHGKFVTPPAFLLLRMRTCMMDMSIPRPGRPGH